MFTSWDQVESWIRDNNFAHWVFYRTNPADSSDKQNNLIADSNFYTGSDEDKIEMTKKYLMMHGGRAWGVGFRTPNATVGGAVCDVRIEDVAQPTNGIGGDQMNIGELTRSITESVTKQIRAEMEAQKYKDERAAFEKEKAEFEEEKKSTIGALVHYFAPIGQMLLQKKVMPRVAGVDTDAPVHAAPIVADHPDDAPEHEEENESPFTDEEEQEIFELLSEFKALEPDCYLKLIRSVVEMKKSGNPMYETAKGFLLK